MAKSFFETLFKEYRWERYVCWLVGLVLLVVWTIGMQSDSIEASTEPLFLGLMFIALGYLSDLRYRLFFEEKEHRARESEEVPSAQQASVR